MEIKSFLHPQIIVLGACTIIYLLVFNILVVLFSDWHLFLFAFISLLLFSLYYLYIIIAYGRTFIFDEKGCTVTLGKKYRKHYSWDVLIPIYYPGRDSKQLRDVHIGVGGFDKIVFFKKKNRNNNQTTNITFNHFNIFVCFSNAQKEDFWSNIYVADRAKFISELNKWKVNVQQNNKL